MSSFHLFELKSVLLNSTFCTDSDNDTEKKTHIGGVETMTSVYQNRKRSHLLHLWICCLLNVTGFYICEVFNCTVLTLVLDWKQFDKAAALWLSFVDSRNAQKEVSSFWADSGHCGKYLIEAAVIEAGYRKKICELLTAEDHFFKMKCCLKFSTKGAMMKTPLRRPLSLSTTGHKCSATPTGRTRWPEQL